AVIGPFYQEHAERTAELLKTADIPVISPLSKEAGKPLPNLYQAMPSTDAGKVAMFAFMMAKNGNIIIVNDPKRTSSRDFITKNYPEAKFAPLDDVGNVNIEKLKILIVKDRKNYVVFEI